MRVRFVIGTVLGLAVSSQAAGEVFVYPKQGQSQEQFQKDQFECHSWAKQQTGFDPSQPSPSASPQYAPQTGGVARGGARGAAVGAIGGAIGGDAGKGAAIGAAVGAAGGGLRQRSANEQAAAATQLAMAQQQGNVQRYEQAYSACMGGRNYQVK